MDLNSLNAVLRRAGIVPELTGLLPPGKEIFLVGGALRDLLLGREAADFDFASPFDPTLLARDFAGRVGGHWFFLDEKRRQSRVVVRRNGGTLTYDFAPYRGPGLEADLRLRDFTVNALALPLPPGETGLLDPLGGRDDLAARRLRSCSGDVFLDDPLRVLKGVRHAACLQFALEGETAERMRIAGPLLERVAPERVRAETGLIFAAEPVASAISLMQSLKLCEAVFGPPGTGGSAVAGGEEAARMEAVLGAARQEGMNGLLAEEIEAGLGRGALLKLAVFLRAYRVVDPAGFCARLRLGRRATASLLHLLVLPASLAMQVDRLPDHDRSRALWAVEAGGSVPDSLLFLAYLRSEPPAAAFARLQPVIADFLRLAQDGRIPDLVDGTWVRERLGVPEGPALGEMLSDLRREEIAGRVTDADAARLFLLRRQEND